MTPGGLSKEGLAKLAEIQTILQDISEDEDGREIIKNYLNEERAMRSSESTAADVTPGVDPIDDWKEKRRE